MTRWLALGVVLAALVTGLVRVAGPALLEPASGSSRWLLTLGVAAVVTLITGLALSRAAVSERGWATLGLLAPGLLVHALASDLFESVFPMLQASSDRAWATLAFVVWGVVATTGFVMGRR
ncbi:MAG: hypothetical protein U1F43_19160 [Myxococcota bacterium]